MLLVILCPLEFILGLLVCNVNDFTDNYLKRISSKGRYTFWNSTEKGHKKSGVLKKCMLRRRKFCIPHHPSRRLTFIIIGINDQVNVVVYKKTLNGWEPPHEMDKMSVKKRKEILLNITKSLNLLEIPNELL